MTVTAFRLENFMAFEDTGWLELRSITLLFGRNSSGKSVLIRALRLLKQSFENNAILKINDEYGVELGEESDIYHGDYDKEYFNKDEKEKNQNKLPTISFGFRIRLDDTARNDYSELLITYYQTQDSITDDLNLEKYDEIDLILSIRWDLSLGGFYLSAFRLECPIGLIFSANRLLDPDLLNALETNWIFDTHILQSFKEVDGENLWAELDVQPLPDAPLIPSFILNRHPSHTQNAQTEYSRLTNILGFVQSAIKKFLADIIYIRPLRFPPELVYTFDLHTQEKWEKLGW